MTPPDPRSPATPASDPVVPIKRHNVSADVEIRVTAVVDEATRQPALDVRLCRRSPSEASSKPEAYHATADGVRIPLHLVPVVSADLMTVARRAAQANAVKP